MDTDLFGTPFIASSGIGSQRALFHEPVTISTPSTSTPVDRAIAEKFDEAATPDIVWGDEPMLGICDGCLDETMVYPCDGAPLAGGAICAKCSAEGEECMRQWDERNRTEDLK